MGITCCKNNNLLDGELNLISKSSKEKVDKLNLAKNKNDDTPNINNNNINSTDDKDLTITYPITMATLNTLTDETQEGLPQHVNYMQLLYIIT